MFHYHQNNPNAPYLMLDDRRHPVCPVCFVRVLELGYLSATCMCCNRRVEPLCCTFPARGVMVLRFCLDCVSSD